MWTCPNCNKSFKTVSQYHSCYTLKVDDHLAGKPENIRKIITDIICYCKQAPKYKLNVVKTGILIRWEANFLSLYPTKNQVRIEFQLPYVVDEFPVSFSKRISKNRVLTKVSLSNPDEFDNQIKNWIKESYELVTGYKFNLD